MEYFQTARSVRLKSYNNKYMVAGEDGNVIKQSRNGDSTKARWEVEITQSDEGKMIRLLSCHGKYLTATDDAFLLGMTGRKVVQSNPTATETEVSIDWEPIQIGCEIKMRARIGSKFLRANWGPPPYKDTITVDGPSNKASRMVMWTVEILETVGDSSGNCNTRLMSCGTAASMSCSDSEFEMTMDDPEEEDHDDDGDSVSDETGSLSLTRLQEDAVKARDLQHESLGVVTVDMVKKKKKEELLLELAEVDSEIKEVERMVKETKAKTEMEEEECCDVIEKKRKACMEMNKQREEVDREEG